jgi:uncharacterized membrane protein
MDTGREEITMRHDAQERDYGNFPSRRRDWESGQQVMGRDRTPGRDWQSYLSEERLPESLGWFSIGLGLAAIAAPRALSRLIGANGNGLVLRAVGLRELASGIGILTNPQPGGWLWARVAGDLMDLALLRMAFARRDASPLRLSAASAAVAGVAVLDVRCSLEHSKLEYGKEDGGWVNKTIIINRTPQELYSYWRDFQNFPRFMDYLESVQITGEKRSHWVAKGPAGKRVEWDAEITADQPNDLIAWRSVEGSSDVEHSGSVKFRPARGGRGTFIRVELEYRPPAGVVGVAVAKLLGRAPDQEIHQSLHRLKQLMEAGEILTTEGQPAGRARSTSWKYDRAVPRVETAVSAHL